MQVETLEVPGGGTDASILTLGESIASSAHSHVFGSSIFQLIRQDRVVEEIHSPSPQKLKLCPTLHTHTHVVMVM